MADEAAGRAADEVEASDLKAVVRIIVQEVVKGRIEMRVGVQLQDNEMDLNGVSMVTNRMDVRGRRV